MPNCRYSQTIAIFFTKRRTPLKCDTILKRPHSLLKCILEPEVVTSYSLLKCILKPEVVTSLWGYARPRLNWWLNWYSPVITSVITKPYLKIVSEMSSPNSLVKCHHQMIQIMLWKYSLLRCHHQNHYWKVITKFVSEMSSPNLWLIKDCKVALAGKTIKHIWFLSFNLNHLFRARWDSNPHLLPK